MANDDNDTPVDDTPHTGKRKSGKKDTVEERPRVDPVEADDPDLALWLAKHFKNGEHPSSFKVFQIHGRGARQALGFEVASHIYNAGKSYHIELFAEISNDFLAAAQRDAKSQGLPRQRYIVCAYDSGRGAKEIGTYPFVVENSATNLALVPANAASAKLDDEDEDEKRNAAGQSFDYTKMSIEATQFDKQHYAHVFGDMFTLQNNMITDLRAENARLHAEIRALTDELRKERKERDEAESRKVERDLAIMEKKMWVDLKKDGFALVRGLVPGLLEDATKGKVQLPGKRSAEALTLEVFLQRCDEKGLIPALFGDWKDDGKGGAVCAKEGIFTLRQGKIIDMVVKGEQPPEFLFHIMPGGGGEDEITMPQIFAAIAVPGMSQDIFAPLQSMFNRLQQKRAAAAAQQASQTVVDTTATATPDQRGSS